MSKNQTSQTQAQTRTPIVSVVASETSKGTPVFYVSLSVQTDVGTFSDNVLASVYSGKRAIKNGTTFKSGQAINIMGVSIHESKDAKERKERLANARSTLTAAGLTLEQIEVALKALA